MDTKNIEQLLHKMTLEEKASLCSGEDFWHTKAIERLGIERMMLSDGPNGVRLQEGEADHLGINQSVSAVCFPTSSAVASSFDTELAYHMGEVLAKECQALGVSMLLGPGVNIKRSPLCGRNFEYYSEDPYLSTKLGAAYIKGVEDQGVGSCIKHYAANNQETKRQTGNSVVDERTLHEIYLASFEGAVKEGKPSGVMCSYNQINGTYAAEHKELLTEILKENWQYQGVVMTDWGAIKDRVKGIIAGLDLEMPGGDSSKKNDRLIVEAVKNGRISEEQLDNTVKRILAFVMKTIEKRNSEIVFDRDADYHEAVSIAKECAVLLKNDKNILPLKKNKMAAFIGGFVEKPRYQGSGSSHINSKKVPKLLDLIQEQSQISYAKGFSVDEDEVDKALEEEAVTLAKNSDVAVIFAGLPGRYETEGTDRNNIHIPENQNALITRVADVQPNTVVVLYNGSPVSMPWIGEVAAVLEMHLAGDGVSEATMALLYGEANPSGKLAETYPIQLEDNPSFLNFPGEDGIVEYHEGIFVGYRYYEKKKSKVLFPFGHGLGYTQFTYSDLTLSDVRATDTDKIKVTVQVKNTGNLTGKEVVQLYVGQKNSKVRRPVKELKGFTKVELKPGEEQEVSFILERRSFSYYETKLHDFYAPTGIYSIAVGSSSADIRLETELAFEAAKALPMEITLETTFADLFEHPKLRPMAEQLLQKMMQRRSGEYREMGEAAVASMGEASGGIMDVILGMSMGAIINFGAMTEEQVYALMEQFRSCL